MLISCNLSFHFSGTNYFHWEKKRFLLVAIFFTIYILKSDIISTFKISMLIAIHTHMPHTHIVDINTVFLLIFTVLFFLFAYLFSLLVYLIFFALAALFNKTIQNTHNFIYYGNILNVSVHIIYLLIVS